MPLSVSQFQGALIAAPQPVLVIPGKGQDVLQCLLLGFQDTTLQPLQGPDPREN